MRGDDCYGSFRTTLSIQGGVLLEMYMQRLFLAVGRSRWVLPDVLAG